MDKEIWKDIAGYEGLYQINNYGDVKSLNYGNTNSENIKHAFKTNLHKKYYGSNHNNAKKIKQYTLEGKFVKEWGSIVEAANYYKTTKENIFSCLKHKSKTAKGYKWEYFK